MAKLKELTEFLDELLLIRNFPDDSSNNGLQCEGNAEVRKAVFGVDACSALFAAAADADADFILVHHGLSWGEGFKRFTGINADRFRMLFANDMSLYAVHLPLDAHPQHGHNAILAEMIGLQKQQMFFTYAGTPIGVAGQMKGAETVETLAEIFADRLDCDYTIFCDHEAKVRKIGVISGGGGRGGVISAVESGLDCLVTGEITHTDYHVVSECGMPVISLGHYKSETPGVLRMMELIKARFRIECEFIDLPTGL